MALKLALHCPSCRARLKAPSELIGQTRNCPACGIAVEITDPALTDTRNEWVVHKDADPILVAEDDATQVLEPLKPTATDPAKRLEELEAENARLRRLVAQLSNGTFE